MLGQDVVTFLQQRGESVSGLGRLDLDVTDATAVSSTVSRLRPEVIVNCAAWTAVDDAESHEAEAMAVNGGGAANLAIACGAAGARLVQVSTDYVFGGTARKPYREGTRPDPRNAYGRTKLAGELAVLARLPSTGYVVRTAWLYGAKGPNFVRTMIGLVRARQVAYVIDDQHGQPTWTQDVAGQIAALIWSRAVPGIYHATSSGQTTWYGLAQEVFRLLGANPARVRAVQSSALAQVAPRPAYTVLGHERWFSAGVTPLPDWRQSLGRAFPEMLTADT